MCSEDLDKNFNHNQAESRIYARWEEEGLFTADPKNPGQPFVIVIPPPNITGNLHMGHALDNTIQDILIRYHRMIGDNTLWLPGTDHAGIATQNVVERALAAEGLSRESLGREKFVEKVWQWKKEYGGNIVRQLRRLGASCDWSRERFTMDEGLSRAVREVFVRLYEEELIYRGDYIINWCPHCLTALADIEVEHEEKNQHLYYLNYEADNLPPLVVATTRPETVFGDTAVAVNPADPRYKQYPGHKVKVPLTDRWIPVIADDYVDLEFGTGALKVTPAHDINDFAIGQRHNLPIIKCLDEKAHLTAEAGSLAGLECHEARRNMESLLADQGLLVKTEPLTHAVGVCYRCKAVVEPLLSRQWFVKTANLASEAAKAVHSGRTKMVPVQWEKTFFEWMDNIRDWCISRQLWWGHQIPAWYCQCGQTVVSRTDPSVCPDCGGPLTRDPDVLDTWFSSGLWPFSTLGWPDKTPELERYYPTTVLVTGFDIIFFWVARMMMMGLKFMNEVPFHTVALHALVRDAKGLKMSKSKGNVIDPLIIIDEYGADAFRFTLAALAGQGRDIKLSTDRVAGYSKFVNKIWNAAKFTFSNLGQASLGQKSVPKSAPDRWILARLSAVSGQCRTAIEEYHFDRLADILYHFIWNEFCDWYLELIKPILYGQNEEERSRTQGVLLEAFSGVLKLLHPLMPFVTEELWSKLPGSSGYIMTAPYPSAEEKADPDAEREIGFLMDVTRSVRQARADFGVPPANKLSPLVKTDDPGLSELLVRHGPLLLKLIGAEKLSLTTLAQKPRETALGAHAWGEVWTPLSGHIDPKAEAERLTKEAKKLEGEIKALKAKLGNQDYIKKAPEDIVEETRERLSTTEAKLGSVSRSLDLIREMEA